MNSSQFKSLRPLNPCQLFILSGLTVEPPSRHRVVNFDSSESVGRAAFGLRPPLVLPSFEAERVVKELDTFHT